LSGFPVIGSTHVAANALVGESMTNPAKYFEAPRRAGDPPELARGFGDSG